MQEINGIRDKIRAEVEDLDGGYTTVAKILKKTTQHVFMTLRPANKPRLSTLEEIKQAVEKAKRLQKSRMEDLMG